MYINVNKSINIYFYLLNRIEILNVLLNDVLKFCIYVFVEVE